MKESTKNPRLVEARNLRRKGATDQDLEDAGFTKNEIARAYVLPAATTTKDAELAVVKQS